MNSYRTKELMVIPALAMVNLLLLLFTQLQELTTGLPIFSYNWGLVPERLTDSLLDGSLQEIGYNLLTLFTSNFLHGSSGHYLGNMLLLLVIGQFVERELGAKRFLVLYVLSGIFASLAHYFTHFLNPFPMIGASGAISGVMGGYLVLLVIGRMRQLKTWASLVVGGFIVYWIVDQVFAMMTPAQSGTIDQVAYMAHFGGIAGGLLFTWLLVRRDPKPAPEPMNDAQSPRSETEGTVETGTPVEGSVDVTVEGSAVVEAERAALETSESAQEAGKVGSAPGKDDTEDRLV